MSQADNATHERISPTGRRVCASPNLQNIPVRTKEGRRIREAFVVAFQSRAVQPEPHSQS